MWAEAQRPGNTCSKVITCFLFTFFYLHSDLMAIKSEAKANAPCIKNERTKRNHNARCEFKCTHTHTLTLTQIYTLATRTPCVRVYVYISKISTHMFFIPHPCVGLP